MTDKNKEQPKKDDRRQNTQDSVKKSDRPGHAQDSVPTRLTDTSGPPPKKK